ncbi:MAG: NRAMP family divalent metal transporter [Sandaracinaceae bacterium]
MDRPKTGWRSAIGPGVLFTGTAVGVSHLVHSTRAGALYGFGLIALIVLANLTKYPAFRFGPLYAAATGRSLLEGYRRQGRWALALYGVLTVGTMFTVQAAVTIVTAGLAIELFGLALDPLLMSGLIWMICVVLVLSGGYRALDGAAKVIVGLLALTTMVATVLVLPRVDWTGSPWLPTAWGPRDIAFMVALVGWMPSAIDVSIWQSMWTLARARQTGTSPEKRSSSIDFHIGYVSTALLAICFLILGAAILHAPGVEVAGAPQAFASQLISLYAAALGGWSRPLIGAAALATMFSTTLTVVDGFPRALSGLAARFRSEEKGIEDGGEPASERTPAYWVALAALGIGSLVILGRFTSAMAPLLDLAAALSFLSAPILSWLNHRAVTAPEIQAEHRPSPRMLLASWVCIAFQGAFAAAFAALQIQSWFGA